MTATQTSPTTTTADQLTSGEHMRRRGALTKWAEVVRLAAEAETAGRPLTSAEVDQVAEAMAATRRPRQKFLDDVKTFKKLLAARAAWAALPSDQEHAKLVADSAAKCQRLFDELAAAQERLMVAQHAHSQLQLVRSAAQERVERAEFAARELLEAGE